MTTIWLIVLFACPPRDGHCTRLTEYPGRYMDESYCERVASTYRLTEEGDRWMTLPGWTPLFTCLRVPTGGGQ